MRLRESCTATPDDSKAVSQKNDLFQSLTRNGESQAKADDLTESATKGDRYPTDGAFPTKQFNCKRPLWMHDARVMTSWTTRETEAPSC
jgi:hypothetical protein